MPTQLAVLIFFSIHVLQLFCNIFIGFFFLSVGSENSKCSRS